MKKWKKYGAFIFAMVMCLSLAACGSSDSIAVSSEETENADSQAGPEEKGTADGQAGPGEKGTADGQAGLGEKETKEKEAEGHEA